MTARPILTGLERPYTGALEVLADYAAMDVKKRNVHFASTSAQADRSDAVVARRT